jgi:hypothetical protein
MGGEDETGQSMGGGQVGLQKRVRMSHRDIPCSGWSSSN